MPHYSSATIVGHLGRDAELKYTQGGDAVCEFSVAVSQGKKDQETTAWYKCALFGKRGESLKQYLTKGKAVLVTGTLLVREWTDKEGAKRTSVEIRASDIVLMGDGKAQDPKPSKAMEDSNEIPF